VATAGGKLAERALGRGGILSGSIRSNSLV